MNNKTPKIRMLKISNDKILGISSGTIIQSHLNTFNTLGKVTYTTSLPIAENNKPDFIILNIGNDDTKCYVCKVEDMDRDIKAKTKIISQKANFQYYLPAQYKDIPETTWLLLSTIQEIDVDFLCSITEDESIRTAIKNRSNNKILK